MRDAATKQAGGVRFDDDRFGDAYRAETRRAQREQAARERSALDDDGSAWASVRTTDSVRRESQAADDRWQRELQDAGLRRQAEGKRQRSIDNAISRYRLRNEPGAASNTRRRQSAQSASRPITIPPPLSPKIDEIERAALAKMRGTRDQQAKPPQPPSRGELLGRALGGVVVAGHTPGQVRGPLLAPRTDGVRVGRGTLRTAGRMVKHPQPQRLLPAVQRGGHLSRVPQPATGSATPTGRPTRRGLLAPPPQRRLGYTPSASVGAFPITPAIVRSGGLTRRASVELLGASSNAPPRGRRRLRLTGAAPYFDPFDIPDARPVRSPGRVDDNPYPYTPGGQPRPDEATPSRPGAPARPRPAEPPESMGGWAPMRPHPTMGTPTLARSRSAPPRLSPDGLRLGGVSGDLGSHLRTRAIERQARRNADRDPSPPPAVMPEYSREAIGRGGGGVADLGRADHRRLGEYRPGMRRILGLQGIGVNRAGQTRAVLARPGLRERILGVPRGYTRGGGWKGGRAIGSRRPSILGPQSRNIITRRFDDTGS